MFVCVLMCAHVVVRKIGESGGEVPESSIATDSH